MTVSGPPCTVKSFLKGNSGFSVTHSESPVRGPYHAQHLHGHTDTMQFLRVTSPRTLVLLASCRRNLCLISTSRGKLYDNNLSATELLAAVIEDVLKQPLHLDLLAETCATSAKDLRPQACHIYSFGANSVRNMIAKALKSDNYPTTVIHGDTSVTISKGLSSYGDMLRTSTKPKLAIVGMAGRFPNAADPKKFWDLLEAGLDVHRKVRAPGLANTAVDSHFADTKRSI